MMSHPVWCQSHPWRPVFYLHSSLWRPFQIAELFFPFRFLGLLKHENEPPYDKTNKMTVRPAKTQISLGIPQVWSVFTVHLMGSWGPNVSSCGQQRLRSDWADAQADMSLRWAQRPFCWFCHEVAHFTGYNNFCTFSSAKLLYGILMLFSFSFGVEK